MNIKLNKNLAVTKIATLQVYGMTLVAQKTNLKHAQTVLKNCFSFKTHLLTSSEHGKEDKVKLYKNHCHNDKVDSGGVDIGTNSGGFVRKIQVISVH